MADDPAILDLSGERIVWKKAIRSDKGFGGKPCLVELRIPASAERIAVVRRSFVNEGYELCFGRKCRTSEAVVLSFTDMDGKEIKLKFALSSYDPAFKYEVGKTAKPTKAFEPDPHIVCAPGIYFCLLAEEAKVQ